MSLEIVCWTAKEYRIKQLSSLVKDIYNSVYIFLLSWLFTEMRSFGTDPNRTCLSARDIYYLKLFETSILEPQPASSQTERESFYFSNRTLAVQEINLKGRKSPIGQVQF